MSFKRKTYDGSIFRRGIGDPSWGDTEYNKIAFDEYASPKRTKRIVSELETEASPFSEDADKDRYIITYADLITLLLGLFVILYAISNIDVKKYEHIISAMGNVFGTERAEIPVTNTSMMTIDKIPTIKTLRESLQDLIEANGYNNVVNLSQNERGITISILDDILFPPGNAELNPDSRTVLSKIALLLRDLPNDIRIEGHTDNIPINTAQYASNWHLSVARATNTAYYLMQYEKLPPAKVSIVGYSEYKPVAPNETPDGRAKNRRVDIVILNK